jgi:F-type H+-transporting ATPase subunit delta
LSEKLRETLAYGGLLCYPAPSEKTGKIVIERDIAVAKSSTAANVIANRYATALIETAEQAKTLDSVEKDIGALASMLGGSDDLKNLISSPVFSREEQQAALTALAKASGFDRLTQNFLGVLSQNRRLYALNAIIKAFQGELSRRRGEVKASVRTAFPLTPEQERALQDSLKKSLGFNVHLDLSVDRDLLGGMVVTVGSRMIDDSVKSKLERLKQVMQSQPQANQNTHMKEVV